MTALDTLRDLAGKLVKRDSFTYIKKQRWVRVGRPVDRPKSAGECGEWVEVWKLVLKLPDGKALELKYCDGVDDELEVIVWDVNRAEMIYSKCGLHTQIAPIERINYVIDYLQRLMVLDTLADI